ncbi:MAG: hypothetical protein HQ582_16160, partial [Planctomycetes bacterium]|nr:hypothetical protein [Planctomycetota bacterium]
MTTVEHIPPASGPKQRSPKERSPPPPDSCKTLIADGPWDSYDLASLLPLKEVVKETAEFGFLLRHYWIPATELRFRRSGRLTRPDGTVESCETQIDRRMARCRSNECTWREWVRPLAANGNGTDSEAAATSEMLCSYDCYEQTYVSAKPLLFEPPPHDQKEEARRQALHRLPILVPPGPVPIGFSWYGKVGDDYTNYRLESQQQVGETLVLVIRREGRYTTWLPGEATNSGNGQETTPVVIQRQGVTLFAWDRGAVLEDRCSDHIVEVGEEASSALSVGTTNQTVIRLV